MEILSLGETIKRRRLELGMSQAALCEGICSTVTLSRIENRSQNTTYQTARALLERLDMPVETGYFLLNKTDLELLELTDEILRRNMKFERAEGAERAALRRETLDRLAELEGQLDLDDRISRQLILRSRVLLGGEEGRWPLADSIPRLLEALRLTAPGFDLSEPGHGPYTDDEIQIINQMAQEYIFAGEYKKAASLLDQLLQYVRKNLWSTPPARARIPLICHNCAIALAHLRRYEDAVEVAEMGRDVCVTNFSSHELPGLLAILAECKHYLGDDRESEQLFRQAYYIYIAIGNEHNRKILVRDARKSLGIELE